MSKDLTTNLHFPDAAGIAGLAKPCFRVHSWAWYPNLPLIFHRLRPWSWQ